jgi:hypothetical protein
VKKEKKMSSLIDCIIQRRLIKLNKKIEILEGKKDYYVSMKKDGRKLDEIDEKRLEKLIYDLNKLYSFMDNLNYGGNLKCK